MEPPVLIAEIGCNHMGQLETAKRMIEVAKSFCDVTHVKFQKRNNRELLSREQYDAPHPAPHNTFGESYGLHREYLEFDIRQHAELKAYGKNLGVECSASVWDLTSLREIIDLAPSWIKIPSAMNTNTYLIDLACNEYSGPIHISLGMTTRIEEEKLVEQIRRCNRLRDTVLYASTSGYPIQFDEICLFEITRLTENYGGELKAIGYSGHHLGIAIDIAAFTLGATYIERHFTLDRTWKGTDHAASVEPDGLRRLKRNLTQTATALSKKDSDVLPVEKSSREKLKWRQPLEPT